MKLIFISAILTTVCFLTSCDAEHMKDYYVKNDLDSTLTFLYTAHGITDSVDIDTGEEKLIYHYSYVFGTVGVDDDRENDPVEDFIVRFDTISKTIHESAWSYEQPGKYHAIYRLGINSELLK